MVKVRKSSKTLFDVMTNIREKSDLDLTNISFEIEHRMLYIHYVNGDTELHEPVRFNSERNYYSDRANYRPIIEFEHHIHKVVLPRFIKALKTLKK